MKRALLFLFASLLFCSVTIAAEAEGKKYAVLVGVNDYVRLTNLRYTKNDIEALRNELYKIGFEQKNVYCLISGAEEKNRPTKENIEIVIETVLKLAKAGDTVVVAMAGHGIEVAGEARFCPADTKEDNLISTTIGIDEIFTKFEKSEATFKLMLVDACRENPFRTRNVAGARSLDTLADPPKGVMLLQSCANGEMSYEDTDLQRGVFTHYLVEGLRGEAANKKGEVTLLSLTSYVIDETQRHALDQFRARQQPYLKGEITDFVLVEKPPFVSSYKDIYEAVQQGSVRDVQYFIEEKGVKVNSKESKSFIGEKKTFDVTSGGKTFSFDNTPTFGSNRMSPFAAAILFGNVEVIKYMISQGADVNDYDALEWAIKGPFNRNNADMLKYLVSQGTDIKKVGDKLLCETENIETVKYLVSQGADVNVKDNYGKTPLHAAASRYEGIECAKLLVSNGADVNERDKNGKTPLDYAKENVRTEIINYLRSVGAR